MNITRDEFIEKYGDIEVKFSSYYKYTFSYTSEDGKTHVSYGGNHDDIYRFEVSASTKYTVKSIGPYSGEHKDGDILDEFYEYY